MTDITIILVCYLLTLGLTVQVKKFLIARALLDHPNDRSSHTAPVPRGGGWALLAVLIPGMFIAAALEHSLAAYAGVIGGTFLLAAISWKDDHGGVSVRARLSLHIAAACIGSLVFPHDALIFGGALPFWLDRFLMIFGWAWFMNLYNFMDGIDGITCVETVAIATGACLVMSVAGIEDPFVSTLTLLLTGAALGFLALNWHPAKIFLGDVGSVPLGYLTGFCLISLALHGQLVPALILPLYYLADSGITIAKRALRGEKIWQAHRQHFYQRATAGLGRHDTVVYLVVLGNFVLIGSALMAVVNPWQGVVLSTVIVAILLFRMHKSGHGPAP